MRTGRRRRYVGDGNITSRRCGFRRRLRLGDCCRLCHSLGCFGGRRRRQHGHDWGRFQPRRTATLAGAVITSQRHSEPCDADTQCLQQISPSHVSLHWLSVGPTAVRWHGHFLGRTTRGKTAKAGKDHAAGRPAERFDCFGCVDPSSCTYYRTGKGRTCGILWIVRERALITACGT